MALLAALAGLPVSVGGEAATFAMALVLEHPQQLRVAELVGPLTNTSPPSTLRIPSSSTRVGSPFIT